MGLPDEGLARGEWLCPAQVSGIQFLSCDSESESPSVSHGLVTKVRNEDIDRTLRSSHFHALCFPLCFHMLNMLDTRHRWNTTSGTDRKAESVEDDCLLVPNYQQHGGCCHRRPARARQQVEKDFSCSTRRHE